MAVVLQPVRRFLDTSKRTRLGRWRTSSTRSDNKPLRLFEDSEMEVTCCSSLVEIPCQVESGVSVFQFAVVIHSCPPCAANNCSSRFLSSPAMAEEEICAVVVVVLVFVLLFGMVLEGRLSDVDAMLKPRENVPDVFAMSSSQLRFMSAS